MAYSQIDNKCIFIGRVSKEPEVQQRQGANGVYKTAKFQIAVDKHLNSQQRTAAQANGAATADFLWIDVVGMDSVIDNVILKYCHVGKAVAVECTFSTWQSTDPQTGQKKFGYNFNLVSISPFLPEDSISYKTTYGNNQQQPQNNQSQGNGNYQQVPNQNQQQNQQQQNFDMFAGMNAPIPAQQNQQQNRQYQDIPKYVPDMPPSGNIPAPGMMNPSEGRPF